MMPKYRTCSVNHSMETENGFKREGQCDSLLVREILFSRLQNPEFFFSCPFNMLMCTFQSVGLLDNRLVREGIRSNGKVRIGLPIQ